MKSLKGAEVGSVWLNETQTIEGDAPMKSFALRINETITKNQSNFFNLLAPITVPVLLESDSYKQSTIDPDVELEFASCRIGARGQFIFNFKPTDARPYKQVEFAESIAFNAFPKLTEALSMMFGWPNTTFGEMKACYHEELMAKAKYNAKAKKVEAEETYKQNPNWGLF